MRIEHVAYMMSDPPTAAKWYCEHLGMRVARCMDKPPYTQFLADAGATADGDIAVTPAGDRLAMLRDPWGFCAQLVERADPML